MRAHSETEMKCITCGKKSVKGSVYCKKCQKTASQSPIKGTFQKIVTSSRVEVISA
jgi:uncharacterized OB-fold protein